MAAPDAKPGFLSAGITAFSPWGSRSTTPKPPQQQPPPQNEDEEKRAASGRGAQRGGDHSINRRPRLSLKKYPSDCPPLAVRWFHAVDVGTPPASALHNVQGSMLMEAGRSPSGSPSRPPNRPTSQPRDRRNGSPSPRTTPVPSSRHTRSRMPKRMRPRRNGAYGARPGLPQLVSRPTQRPAPASP
jgi:hypothetical protein